MYIAAKYTRPLRIKSAEQPTVNYENLKHQERKYATDIIQDSALFVSRKPVKAEQKIFDSDNVGSTNITTSRI